MCASSASWFDVPSDPSWPCRLVRWPSRMEGVFWWIGGVSSQGEPALSEEVGSHPVDGPPASPAPNPGAITPATEESEGAERSVRDAQALCVAGDRLLRCFIVNRRTAHSISTYRLTLYFTFPRSRGGLVAEATEWRVRRRESYTF